MKAENILPGQFDAPLLTWADTACWLSTPVDDCASHLKA